MSYPKILFPHIEKTAGTTLNQILKSYFGLRYVNLMPIENGSFVTNKDVLIAEGMSLVKPIIFSSHSIRLDKINLDQFDYILITIREPYKRFESHVNHLKRFGKRDTYDTESLCHELRNHQKNFFGGIDIESICEKLILIRQETLEKDIEDVFSLQVNLSKNINLNKSFLNIEELFNSVSKEEIEWYKNKVSSFKNHIKLDYLLEGFSRRKINISSSNIQRKYFHLPIMLLINRFLFSQKMGIKQMKAFY